MRKVISMGEKWRVGDGRDIWVFKDFWLLGNSSGQVTSPPLVLDVDTCVANLINDSVGWWNTGIIDEHFSPFEAQSIKSIPLCISPQPDYLHWPLERNGNYSVKSGFKLLCEESSRDEASSSNLAAATSFWLSIWKLKVSGKVKYFQGRVYSNSLPTKANIMKRKIS